MKKNPALIRQDFEEPEIWGKGCEVVNGNTRFNQVVVVDDLVGVVVGDDDLHCGVPLSFMYTLYHSFHRLSSKDCVKSPASEVSLCKLTQTRKNKVR